jgi:hypothetical protein
MGVPLSRFLAWFWENLPIFHAPGSWSFADVATHVTFGNRGDFAESVYEPIKNLGSYFRGTACSIASRYKERSVEFQVSGSVTILHRCPFVNFKELDVNKISGSVGYAAMNICERCGNLTSLTVI